MKPKSREIVSFSARARRIPSCAGGRAPLAGERKCAGRDAKSRGEWLENEIR